MEQGYKTQEVGDKGANARIFDNVGQSDKPPMTRIAEVDDPELWEYNPQVSWANVT